MRPLTQFRKIYERGDFPLVIRHGAKSVLEWKVPVESLDAAYYLPIFLDGIKEKVYPFNFVAREGSFEFIRSGDIEQLLVAIDSLAHQIKCALDTHDSAVIMLALRMLQALSLRSDSIAKALVPHYRQLLHVLNMYKPKRRHLGDQIDFAQFKHDGRTLGDKIEETLTVLEQTAGPEAFPFIKYMVPTFESGHSINPINQLGDPSHHNVAREVTCDDAYATRDDVCILNATRDDVSAPNATRDDVCTANVTRDDVCTTNATRDVTGDLCTPDDTPDNACTFSRQIQGPERPSMCSLLEQALSVDETFTVDVPVHSVQLEESCVAEHVAELHTDEPHMDEPDTDEPHMEEPHTDGHQWEPCMQEPHVEDAHMDEPQINAPHTDDSLVEEANIAHLNEPHMEEPHIDEPHLEESHIEEPHMAEPHMVEPHMDEPHMVKPHMDESHLDEPHMDWPPMDEPHMFEQPHMDVPHMDEPHMDESHLDESHMCEPHMDAHMADFHINEPLPGEPLDEPHMFEPHMDATMADIHVNEFLPGEPHGESHTDEPHMEETHIEQVHSASLEAPHLVEPQVEVLAYFNEAFARLDADLAGDRVRLEDCTVQLEGHTVQLEGPTVQFEGHTVKLEGHTVILNEAQPQLVEHAEAQSATTHRNLPHVNPDDTVRPISASFIVHANNTEYSD